MGVDRRVCTFYGYKIKYNEVFKKLNTWEKGDVLDLYDMIEALPGAEGLTFQPMDDSKDFYIFVQLTYKNLEKQDGVQIKLEATVTDHVSADTEYKIKDFIREKGLTIEDKGWFLISDWI